MVRIAVLDRWKCRPKNCDYLCIKVCPRVRMGDETITIDEAKKKPIIIEELCAGCGICVNKCPFNALTITNLPEEHGVLTHQYGKNSFRLYGLPVPKKGSIVGIIGVNGIGKSTAINILAGNLKPNLGEYEKEPEWDEVIESYRGNEVQEYLTGLKEGQTKAVLKPQYVDMIPESMKGSVNALLDKLSGERDVDGLVKTFGMGSCVENDIDKLSGGELQRLAIIAAMAKDSDIYLFDEPTSYLDISQRLLVAKTIRHLAAEGKAVLVIEHDLIVLDYLSDYIHLTYGVKGAYGIISQIKSSRVGINEYLQGQMKNENVRIRSDAIQFDGRATGVIKSKDLLTEYPNIDKAFEHFSLSVNNGDLYNSEVVGVVGPNATGKTTFVKVLAGELENDGKKLDTGLSVSYKPQYIKPVDKTVREVLSSVTNKLYKSGYKREILEPFELEDLLERNLKDMSGGEVQRVAVAECLSRDADIYLMDEPSAYLDIEQRLVAAKAIRRFMEEKKKAALIVDHDIAFVDYISDKLMVFAGKPGIEGKASGTLEMEKGMNEFLGGMKVTFRRDEDSNRPKANKPGSQKDKEQKKSGKYYYNC